LFHQNKSTEMKYTLLLLAIGAALFASCQSDPKADNAQTGEAQQVTTPAGGTTYKADLAQSRVEWTGTKPVGQHHGSMNLKDGSLKVDNGNVTGGTFTIDMSTLKVLDKDTAGTSKLAGHLSSGDFFDVAKYPTAAFEITNIKSGIDSAAGKELVMKDATHTVTGNLTLKGTTKSVTFPAKLAVNEAMVTADANFNIDRTQWGLVYGNDQSLGDKFIRPTVNIQLHLVANK
jgi:polyisoprenoid-binding protein YceI